MTGRDLLGFLEAGGHGRAFTEYAKGSVIFRQGSSADAVHYLRSGKVKLTVTSRKGKDAVIAILGRGAFLGEGCLVEQSVRRATAQTMADSSVIRWGKDELTALLTAKPALRRMFAVHLLTRVSRLEEDLVDQFFHSTEKRLARVLLRLAGLREEDGSRRIRPPISHETLAEIVGTTRPRVSHFMSKFRKLGFITYNGDLEVHGSLLKAALKLP